jgi:hypothetical protein
LRVWVAFPYTSPPKLNIPIVELPAAAPPARAALAEVPYAFAQLEYVYFSLQPELYKQQLVIPIAKIPIAQFPVADPALEPLVLAVADTLEQHAYVYLSL